MKLSSAYLYEQLNRMYKIAGCSGLSGSDGYLRPLLFTCKEALDAPVEKVSLMGKGHVCVIAMEEPETSGSIVEKFSENGGPEDVMQIICCSGGSRAKSLRTTETISCAADDLPQANQQKSVQISQKQEGVQTSRQPMEQWDYPEKFPGSGACVWLIPEEGQDIFQVLNELQNIFDRCDEWDGKIHQLLTQNAGMGKILEVTSEFLGNPLLVMGLDFSLVAESASWMLPQSARLFTEDGVNMEYMNALLQDATYQKMAQTSRTVLFPAYIGSCRSLNRNLYVEGVATHRLVLTECKTPITPGNICFLEAMTERLEYLLAHEAASSITGDLEQVFQRLLSDRTADYIQISRQLSALGWSGSHEYLCLILQITYLNQKQLSTRAICRYIRKQLGDSISFLYKEEIVTFFNLSRLGMSEDEVTAKLVYFIRDSYLKAGYSRVMEGHMNLRRQYVQARTALDVGSRKKPYLWIHHFSQVALTYIMEQATRRLPGNMLCHEGLLRLKEQDEKNHTEYMLTLKTYLEQHLNATQAAKELFIHRSTFLYRLDKIREILQSDLEDAEEVFYLELSLRLLEQEQEKR